MAAVAPLERLQPALLDRLTDLEPDKKTESRDGRVMSSTTVVVRVGTAVYAEHTRRPTPSSAAALSTRTEAEIDSVASYVPTLAPFEESD